MLSINSISYSQSNCVSFWNRNKPKLHLWLEKDSLFIKTEGEEISDDLIFQGNIIFKGKYFIKKDTLIVQMNNKQFLFQIIDDGIVKALFQLNNYIDKNDIFYCSRYEFKNGDLLVGSNWKMNKKEGKWLYISKLGKSYRLTFKEGKLIKREKL